MRLFLDFLFEKVNFGSLNPRQLLRLRHRRFVQAGEATGKGEPEAEEAVLQMPAGARGPSGFSGRGGREGPARNAGFAGAQGRAGVVRLPHAYGGRHQARHR